MNFKILILFIGIFLFITGCTSTTPGDAAYQGKHYEQAANLYHQGAKLGDKNAALKLGLMISEKKITSSSYGNAVEWFIKACELGSDAGCHNSGNSYEYGTMGTKKDYNIARRYYTIAANNGFIQSQYNLGTLYANKYFNNDVEGLKWIFIAKKSADTCSNNPICQWVKKDPPQHQNKLMNRMDTEQIKSAKNKAKTWIVQ